MSSQQKLLVYDGECGFCTAAADWISQRWPDNDGSPIAGPWQKLAPSVLEAAGPNPEDVMRAAWWIQDGQHEEGSRAVARALIAAGGSWAIGGRVLLIPPISWIGQIVYRVVAHYRYRLPGGTPACRV